MSTYAYWATVAIFFIAFIRFYNHWTHSGNANARTTGRICFWMSVSMGVAWPFLPPL